MGQPSESGTLAFRLDVRRLAVRGVLGAMLSWLANVLVFLVTNQLMEAGVRVTQGPGSAALVPLRATDLLIASTVPTVPALAVWVAVQLYASRPRQLLLWISVGVLAVSLVPVMMLPSGLASRLVLGLMHLLSAMTITGAFLWRS